MVIRPAQGSDWPRIREICCLTGRLGEPIASERFPFFGQYWVGPYQAFEKNWSFVSEVDGQIAGYLTGAPDTRRHERLTQLIHHPLLLAAVVARQYPMNDDVKRFVRRFLRIEKGPNESFPRDLWRTLHREYPAHLHTNTDSPFRGRGLGAALIERYRQELLRARVPGVHLFCGEKPLNFYRRAGFEELARVEFKPEVWVYCLGRRLT